MKIVIIYRISDHSNPEKVKPDYASKENCLRTLVREFGSDNLHIICDNVSQQTYDMVKQYSNNVELTNNGNTGSFLYSWNKAYELTKDMPADTIVYLVEDDYIHCRGAKEILIEAFRDLNAPYATLYDHPDKYQDNKDSRYEWGHGKIDIDDNGIRKPKNIYMKGEDTVVYASKSCHWKLTSSTTMTFAAKVKTLREDEPIWRKHIEGKHPNDFGCFIELRNNGRSLSSPIPGLSTHCEPMWAAPLIDWEQVN